MVIYVPRSFGGTLMIQVGPPPASNAVVKVRSGKTSVKVRKA